MLFSNAIELYGDHLINQERRPKTVKGYTQDLRFFQKHLEVEFNGPVSMKDLKKDSVAGFLLFLKQVRNYKPASRRRLAATIQGFLNYAYKQRWINEPLADEVPQIRVPESERDYLKPEQVEQWAEAVNHDVVQVAIWIMYYGGLRISEAVNLTMNDVHLTENGGWLDIRDTKGGKSRKVPIAPKLVPILEDYMKWRVDSKYLLATKKTGWIATQTIQSEMREARKKLGWSSGITPHTLRHSFASHIYQKTGDILVVSKLLGHTKLSTTQIYAHLHEDQMFDAVNVL